jgi:exopolysaccharide production protein ExoQ
MREMTYTSCIPHTNVRLRSTAKRTPWLAFAFLSTVFFLTSHDLGQAKRGMDEYNLTRDELVSRSEEGPPARRVALVVLGISAIVSLLRFRANGRLHTDSLLGWTLILFVGWALLSPVWAVDLPLTMKRLMPFGIFCIAALAAARRFSLSEIIRWTFVSTTVYLLISILAAVFSGTFRPFTPGYRFTGSLDPNSQGVDCALLLLSAAASADLDRRWRVPAAAGGFLGFIFLMLTGSRTSFATALLGVVVYAIAVRSRASKFATACGVSVIVCSLLLFMGGELIPKIKNTILLGRDEPGSVDSFNGRSMIWNDLSFYTGQHPILGFGYGGFWNPKHISEISDEEKSGGISSGHSAYLDYLLTLGGVGLVTYSLLLLGGIWRAFRFYLLSRNVAYAFCGAFLVFCALDGILDSNITMAGALLMFLWLVVLARLAFIEAPLPAAVYHS